MGLAKTIQELELKEANEKDWESLSLFFEEIYKPGHPLRKFEFWNWQFGDPTQGRSFVAVDNGKVVGHVGATFGGNYSWVINVYLFEAYRGRGLLRKLYGMSRDYFPIAATNINQAGLDMYRNMGYIRYSDLNRFVAINPSKKNPLRRTELKSELPKPSGHFWDQPGIQGVSLPDGSTAVLQMDVGGLRIMELGDPNKLTQLCWDLDFGWVDYITSWNDPTCRILQKEDWTCGDPIPWRLNPIQMGSTSEISFVSEEPMPKDFIVKRIYSDHARIGSLN